MFCDMQEAADLSCEALVHIVDEGIEEARLPVEGDDIVVGDAGGDEGAMAFTQQDLVASAADLDAAVASDAHGDDEG